MYFEEENWDYEDYFDEDGIEPVFNEIKEQLKYCVAKEVRDELERLRKQVEQMTPICSDYQNKLNELESKKRNLEYDIRRERLSTLLKEFSTEIYVVKNVGKEKPKCNRCDGRRMIHYTSPMGKEQTEYCDCWSKMVWFGTEEYALDYIHEDNWGDREVWLRYKRIDTANDYFNSVSIQHTCDNDSFETLIANQLAKNKELKYGEWFFRDKDKAQAFADYLNEEYYKIEYDGDKQ